VRPLRAVEQIFLLGLWAGGRAGRVLGRVEGVRVGVEDAGCFAVGAAAEAVPGGEEEAGGGGEEDVAEGNGGRSVGTGSEGGLESWATVAHPYSRGTVIVIALLMNVVDRITGGFGCQWQLARKVVNPKVDETLYKLYARDRPRRNSWTCNSQSDMLEASKLGIITSDLKEKAGKRDVVVIFPLINPSYLGSLVFSCSSPFCPS